MEDYQQSSIPWHWDKDEDLRVATGGLFVHPHLSTVTYLSSFGAPTMILDARVGNMQTGEPDFERKIEAAFISWPFLGKHLVFDGALLHGAPSELLPREDNAMHPPSNDSKTTNSEENCKRITFLVNIWLNYRPLDLRPFPDEKVQSLALPSDIHGHQRFRDFYQTLDINYQDTDDSMCIESYDWTLGGPVVIRSHLVSSQLHQTRHNGGNVRIRWGPHNASQILVKNSELPESTS